METRNNILMPPKRFEKLAFDSRSQADRGHVSYWNLHFLSPGWNIRDFDPPGVVALRAGYHVGPQTYNQLFTLHGAIMIFLFIIPGIPASFGNFVLPLHAGG